MTNLNFYEQLRAKLHAWAQSSDGKKSKWVEYLLILPDLFYLLAALALDPEISAKHKAKLGLVIAYIISPLDLMPEAILGPAGYLDDLTLAAYAINQLVNSVDQKIILRHWKGDGDLLQVIRHIIEVADEMVGSGLWKRLSGLFNNP